MDKLPMWVLMENTPCKEGICAEHGLSLYLETPRHRLLFDTGQSGKFGDNARQMGVDLSRVDVAILSHGHYDHGGGLSVFLRENVTAPVYLSRYAFQPHFSGPGRYIGLDPSLAGNPRLRPTEDHQVLDQELELFSCNGFSQPYPTDPAGLSMEVDGRRQPEDFRHEQYLLLHHQGRRVLISGCSHKGILNLVEWFQPDVLVGGFHLMKQNPEDPEDRARMLEIAQRLAAYPTTYYTGHCTGEGQYALLKSVLGDRLHPIRAGSQLTI